MIVYQLKKKIFFVMNNKCNLFTYFFYIFLKVRALNITFGIFNYNLQNIIGYYAGDKFEVGAQLGLSGVTGQPPGQVFEHVSILAGLI